VSDDLIRFDYPTGAWLELRRSQLHMRESIENDLYCHFYGPIPSANHWLEVSAEREATAVINRARES